MTEIPKLIRRYSLPFDRFDVSYTDKQKEKLNIAFDNLIDSWIREPVAYNCVKSELTYLYHWSKEAYYFTINTKEFKEAVRLDFMHKKLEVYLKNIKEYDEEYANKIANENIEEKEIFKETLIDSNKDDCYIEKYKDTSSYDYNLRIL